MQDPTLITVLSYKKCIIPFPRKFVSSTSSLHCRTFRQRSLFCLCVHSPTFHPASISVNVRGGCVSMATGFATGLWEVRECASSKAKFICRQNQDTSLSPEPPVPQPTPSLSGSCPSSWKSNSNLRYCYKVHRAKSHSVTPSVLHQNLNN